METLIGRQPEQRMLQEIYDEPSAQLIAVYGRRRVGKTFLVKQFFKGRLCLSFTGSLGCSAHDQLRLFANVLSEAWGCPVNPPKDWFEAFELLKRYLLLLDADRRVVFLDELPWLDTPRSKFLAAFSFFWNNWAESQPGLKIIVCGSATSWMIEKLIGSKGGLYGRISQTLHLRPFTLAETEAFLRAKGIVWNRSLILQAYMIFGGIPYYLAFLKKELPLSVNVDNLLFSPSARLAQEYDFLFRSLFNNSEFYRRIVEELAGKKRGMTLDELRNTLDVGPGGYLTNALETLIRCEFVRMYFPYGRKKKGALYQLMDPFCIFHLSFIAGRSALDGRFWNKVNPAERSVWAGYAFERVCLLHLPQIQYKLQLGGMLVSVHAWSTKAFEDKDGVRWPGAQIDLILDRADHIVDLCEIKFTERPFAISTAYEKKLLDRAESFVRSTGTKSTPRIVFITNEGVRDNAHASVVQGSVTAEDLFCVTQTL